MTDLFLDEMKPRPSHRWQMLAACMLVFFAPGLSAFGQDITEDLYPDRVWDGPNGGTMHISGFAFRDLNGNGIDDLGDRPFAYIAVQLSRPAGPPVVARSNISGYVNFDASATAPDAQIAEPGIYGFRVIVPEGWRITTANADQSLPVERLEGAPGDLVAKDLPTPVGLAPILAIKGRDLVGGMVVTGPNADASPVSPDLDGRFSVPVSPGDWFLKTSEMERPRQVSVTAYPVVISGSSDPLEEEGGMATIDFEDLIHGEFVAHIPNGYNQLKWDNWVVTHNRTYAGEGYINGTVSGEYVAYNGSGHPASIESDAPFDFAGGHFTLAWADAEGETLQVRAWQGDILRYEDHIRLSALGPVFFDADYRAITRLELATEHYWQVVADDLLLRPTQISSEQTGD